MRPGAREMTPYMQLFVAGLLFCFLLALVATNHFGAAFAPAIAEVLEALS